MTSLVLIGRPKSLHIMAQAMAAPSAQESHWDFGKIETARLGAQCVHWILSRGKEHVIRLVHTRNYGPKQTGFYAGWLLIQEDEAAKEFVAACSPFQITNRLERLQQTGRSSPHAWTSGCIGAGPHKQAPTVTVAGQIIVAALKK